jgi:septum site-determining protein MinC
MRFVGRSYMAFMLAPEPPIFEWLVELDEWIRGAGGFFVGRPVVLDLSAVTLSKSAIAHLIGELQGRDISVMGIENTDPAQLGPGLPPLLRGGRPASAEVAEPAARDKAKSAAPPCNEPATLLLDSPVRSGQSIFFPDGDVTVLGSVASGAELVAGGSIHVYGTLRGRAMAGSNGNARARIFCSRIDAELLAINSYYRTADSMDPRLRDRPVQAWLDGKTMMIAALD